MITSLEARDDLTWSIVTSKLIDEGKQRNLKNVDSNEKLLRVKHKNSRTFCNYCKRPNHDIKECRTLQYNKKHNKNKVDTINEKHSHDTDDSDGEMLLGVCSEKSQFKWILDSGATSNFVKDKSILSNFQHKNDIVTVANNSKVKILGIGETTIKLVNEKGISRTARLTNVLYSPDLTGNFISIKKLQDKGFKIIFENNKCAVYFKNKQITTANLINDFYYVNHEKLSAITTTKKCIHVWHRILGHRDIEAIKIMFNKQLVSGIEIDKCNCDKNDT